MAELPAPFVVGVSRSGTTLLRMMLDSHPHLAVPFETHFLDAIIAWGQKTLSPAQFLAIVTQAQSWPNMAIDAAVLAREVEAIAPFRVPEALRAFYRICAARFGKNRWGDKTPHYLRLMAPIQEILPEAHFIHIIRDGRDTALSFRGLWWGPGDEVDAAARFWSADINRARSQARELNHYLEIRYEDLVLRPVDTLTKIADYVAIGFDPAMLDYYKSAAGRLADMVRPIGPNGGKDLDVETFRSIHLNTKKPPDASRLGRWRTEMPDHEQQAFEAIAGSLLAELGYPTRFS
jgi:hypothetical protein